MFRVYFIFVCFQFHNGFVYSKLMRPHIYKKSVSSNQHTTQAISYVNPENYENRHIIHIASPSLWCIYIYIYILRVIQATHASHIIILLSLSFFFAFFLSLPSCCSVTLFRRFFLFCYFSTVLAYHKPPHLKNYTHTGFLFFFAAALYVFCFHPAQAPATVTRRMTTADDDVLFSRNKRKNAHKVKLTKNIRNTFISPIIII